MWDVTWCYIWKSFPQIYSALSSGLYLGALFRNVSQGSIVHFLVGCNLVLYSKMFPAYFTSKRFLSSMYSQMTGNISFQMEFAAAHITGISSESHTLVFLDHYFIVWKKEKEINSLLHNNAFEIWVLRWQNLSSGFSIRLYQNQPAQLQRLAVNLKFRQKQN